MNNAALLKSLVTYAIVVPVALLLGYFLTDPASVSTAFYAGLVLFVLAFPLLAKWHYQILLFSWSATIILFFVKGAPNFGQLMIAISLTLSVLERILNPKRQFIRVPSIAAPLIALVIVVVITAKFTGGIGMHSFGSDVYGGRKYIFMFLGIAGFFALISRPIPPERAKLYAALYLLGGVTTLIGDMYPFAPSWSRIIFSIFPPSGAAIREGFDVGGARLAGIANAAVAAYIWMLARYGLRGILFGGRFWRPLALLAFLFLVFLGGYRSSVFLIGLATAFMFFSEKLYRTRSLPVFVLAGVLGASLLVVTADKLPFTFQRALAFLPLHLDPVARADAQSSTNWRIQLWTALLPQIPQHLLLGKGYVISQDDYDQMMGGGLSAYHTVDAAGQGLALAGDYHNGMLSVVLCFGIWGVVIIVWFIFAGLRVMCRNLKYGRPDLYTINSILFILYFNEVASYLSCFGGLGIATDMVFFTGPLGLSIALNHGICRRPPKPVPVVETVGQRRLIPTMPAFQS
ncbi:MAG: O-antigen ligase family protein [Limisphaerales bacterium]